MQATNAKPHGLDDVLSQKVRSTLQVGTMARVLSSFLGSALLLSVLYGCGPPSSQGGSGQDSNASASQEVLELTKEIIDERINDARVYDVMPESGTGDPIAWSFDADEPKEIVVVDQQINGASATLTLDIKTQSAPYARNLRQLAGQVRTEWLLETGWVLRRWEIVNTENISMKYKDLPKAAPN